MGGAVIYTPFPKQNIIIIIVNPILIWIYPYKWGWPDYPSLTAISPTPALHLPSRSVTTSQDILAIEVSSNVVDM